MKTALLTLTIFCFWSHFARGEPVESVRGEPAHLGPIEQVESIRIDTDIFPMNCSVSVPDISEWEVSQTSRIGFRLSGETVSYLGVDIEHTTYHNPDSGEFMKVFNRHIPLILSSPKQTNERVISDVATAIYVQKDEEDRFDEIGKKMDPFLYVYWLVRENPRNGNDMLDSDVDIWFMPPDGSCRFFQNEPIKVRFLTENIGNGKARNVLVGVQYQIGGVYHILKVDRRDVVHLMEGGN